MPTTQTISKRGSAAFGSGCGGVLLAVFGLLFGAVGVGLAYWISGVPLMNLQRARHWQPAQCEITFSQVNVTHDSDGSTSRIDIQYRYVWNDRIYTGTHYDFTVGSDNFDNAGKRAIVDQHRPGTVVPCFVNPDDPTQAVINRDMKWGYLFGLAFGTPFALVPVFIFGLVIHTRRQAKRKQAATIVTSGATHIAGGSISLSSGGPVVLKPESSRIGRLIAMVIFCLIWNGLIGVFTYFEIKGDMAGGGGANWFLGLFMIPFQLVGLFLLWSVISALLTLANPKPILTLSAASVPVGGSLTVQWQMRGAAGRLNDLRMVLRGREEARYRRGTSHYTDKHTFYEAQIAEATEASRIERGMATITIPRNTMHSFASDDNKIIWTLQVTGDISRWPDVDETFDLVVRPS